MSPEYLAPGVYIEEVPVQTHPIAGVSLSTRAYLVLLAKQLSTLRTMDVPLRKRGSGPRVLFVGPNKRPRLLAARVLASELHLRLYRIDLSAVVSKYIGETEKNLRRVFDAAEKAGAILFFDEADALFGKRSGVKDSHDRYANIEVAYFLQRMEEFEGIAILATNRKESIDAAFLRRCKFIIPIPLRNTGTPNKPKRKRTRND